MCTSCNLHKSNIFYVLLVLFFLLPTWGKCQRPPAIDSVIKTIRPFLMLQSWGVYTRNEQIASGTPAVLMPVDDRANFFFRRARLGFKGEPQYRIRYTLVLFYDNLGKDELTGVRGTGNNEAIFGIWDAFVQWKVFANQDYLNLTAGYFRPQVSRENLTSAWEVNSFEKAVSQLYVRRHLVERNHGRASGINLGGLRLGTNSSWYYNLGVFNTTNTSTDPATIGNSSGIRWSPLWAGRISFSYGDPEMTQYSVAHEINYYNQRRGLTWSWYAAHQGATDLFMRSQIIGTDLLFNFDNLNLDAEINRLYRRYTHGRRQAYAGHIRGGINIDLSPKFLLEPALMWSFFRSNQVATGNAFTGRDQTWDVGLNFYWQKTRFKTNIHYVWQAGKGNNLYTQQNGRQVAKGDYLGLGLQFII